MDPFMARSYPGQRAARQRRSRLQPSVTRGIFGGMTKNRLEAFSDGVLAIVITIMVLELQAPHEATLHALLNLWPVLLSYVISFVYIAIYWNNHHHMLQAARKVSGGVLWANMHLLFWLSLVPFTTAWMGENHFVDLPTALYGFVLLASAVAYSMLQTAIIRAEGKDSPLARAVGRDWKGKGSALAYAIAVPCAFWVPELAWGVYVAVALVWLVPDRRIERALRE
jgi:uncharacterized membrane protein